MTLHVAKPARGRKRVRYNFFASLSDHFALRDRPAMNFVRFPQTASHAKGKGACVPHAASDIPEGTETFQTGEHMILSLARRCVIAALVLGVLTLAPIRAGAAEVLVFAAASLKTALDEIAPAFEQQTGYEVTVSYAASSVLARQIQLGAPADLFISANVNWMDVLQDQGMIDVVSRVDLLGNGLVLIGGTEQTQIGKMQSSTDLSGALGSGYLAMALVDAVPAGVYGKTALQSLGLWGGIEDQVAQTDNVRAALALVAAGAAPLGIVYQSDAQADERVRIIASFPPDTHPPIIYPAAVTVTAKPEAHALLDYLRSDAARNVFMEQGFALPGS